METKTEIEIKLRVADRPQLLRQLARLRAELIAARVHEMNTLYDTAQGGLLRHGRMLRVRVERPASRSKGAGQIRGHIKGHLKEKTRQGPAAGDSGFSALLTFKGPAGPSQRRTKRAAEKIGKTKRTADYKIREEHEIRVSDQEEASRIIEGLGLRPCFRYEKFRTTYRLPGIKNLKLDVDETPIGLFLELEGPRGEIDRAAARLGFGPAEYITQSYGALFMEERGVGRGLKSRKRAGAKREAGKAFHHEPADERTSELARFSGLGDMLFRSSR